MLAHTFRWLRRQLQGRNGMVEGHGGQEAQKEKPEIRRVIL